MTVATQEIIEVLEDAKSIITHDGWWGRGQMCRANAHDPGVCATGAVAIATGDIKPVKRTNDELLFDVTVVDPSDRVWSQRYQAAVLELGLTAMQRRARKGDYLDREYVKQALRRGIDANQATEYVIGLNDNAQRRAEITTLFTNTIKRLKKEIRKA